MKKRDYNKPPRVCTKIANLLYRDNILDELEERGLIDWDIEYYGKYVFEGMFLNNFEICVDYIDEYTMYCKLK